MNLQSKTFQKHNNYWKATKFSDQKDQSFSGKNVSEELNEIRTCYVSCRFFRSNPLTDWTKFE